MKRRFLDTKGAAQFTSIAASSLEALRKRGGGPPYYRRGRKILYDTQELVDWIKNQETGEQEANK